ncbi:arabinan endo-1,5-alpha-L-arabinosidase [Archangium gephyra]|uniref:Arabinan endo-1,5-alpha-L-arabinosidase n=1 Tax=Archangium gephyra TaxID=48 RepID=A0AAC8Q7L6_9BACT|nr:family 43 glycosylhydrolase [Archangium gephyra]AKJ02497.1 Arabinan endo-1,5-alpha-L-arabinosidase [Archangium gephyra]REG28582.1 arabinan endo-1,5-alpha-L-arabinosidase [Archangium gephyra]
MLAVLSATACSDKEKPPENPPEEPPPPPPPPPPDGPVLVTKSFTNPLRVSIPGGGSVETCADPAVIRGQKPGDTAWYMYCTSDPLNDQDKDPGTGHYRRHLLPMLRSTDLVSWTYVGDALTAPPSWARPDSGLWAPEIVFFGNQYHLYYTVVDTVAGGSAIGVATSTSPTGPWTQADKATVEPHEAPCCSGNGPRWTFDPEVLIAADGSKYIYYGSYFGGISARKLSEDGLTSDVASQVQITIPNRYEAASLMKHGDDYYLFVSASNCCNGPLSGYSVFAGRSRNPLGPFVDREGTPLTDSRVGGTPVLGLNGNRWVGPGHNTLLTDLGGQDWILYHAMDRASPYMAPSPGALISKRPVLMDALDWVDGWPVTRGGQGASDTEQPAPAAEAQNTKSRYTMVLAKQDEPGALIPSASDEFNDPALGAQWSWVRPPPSTEFGLESGSFRFNTQAADLYVDDDTAAILWQQAPTGDYLVETKLTMNLPATGCCQNYVQAGLVLHGDEDNYVKLVQLSYWDTRQVAFAKEVGPGVPAGYPRYGETAGGPADETLWLRIARRIVGQEEHFTAYSSRDGGYWSRAGTWTHNLGTGARIGLVSQSGSGFVATFDYVRVHELKD